MEYHNTLKAKIHLIIFNDLTVGRSDNDLRPFTEYEVFHFIELNQNNIETALDNIIQEYTDSDELESLNNPELDWIAEYLYEFVDTTNVDLF